ncbi:hypothetical protein A9D36_11490 [Bacillus subtilis]|nr:hypothetical protein A9D36_11490 [Bacillus subtilis]
MKGLNDADDRFVLLKVKAALAPLVSVVPLQLIAYYAALHRAAVRLINCVTLRRVLLWRNKFNLFGYLAEGVFSMDN